MVGIAVDPYLVGLAYDTWGDYRAPFAIAAVGLAVLYVRPARLLRFPDLAVANAGL